jgi:ADP-ribosyl-[dinitrogen reductase] hydrolase
MDKPGSRPYGDPMELMLATAVGDAYGACFEYSDADARRPNALRYVQNVRHRSLKPGHYTDDTQMSMAVMECILDGKLETSDFADAFVGAFRRDPRQGYARGFQAFLETCADGGQLLADIRPDSAKSGAAMRSGPLALLCDLGTVERVARLQARITHDTEGGIISSTGVAMAGFALRTGLCSRQDLPRWLSMNTSVDWTQPWLRPVGSLGLDSACAAIWIVSRHADYAGLLKAGVDLTGDVDTVLALACGLLSWTNPTPLPQELVLGLEQGKFGKTYLDALDARAAVFLRPASHSAPG